MRALAAVALLSSSIALAGPVARASRHRPRLAVLVVVDQFSSEAFRRIRPRLVAGGFARFVDEGAFYADARYRHADTATAPGHAVLATGAYPRDTGIVDNIVWDRAGKRAVSILHDEAQAHFGGEPMKSLDDTSPAALLVDGLADQLKLATGGRSRSVAIAYKARAAILLAGRSGSAYWISDALGGLTSSAYYGAELPAWAKAFDATKPADRYAGASWKATLAEADYLGATDDDMAYEEGPHGLGKSFPHPLPAAPGAELLAALFSTPLGTDVLLAGALAAVRGEHLGADEWPDFLAVSVAAIDAIGHHFGPNSREEEEALLATDRQLAAFFAELDKRVGRDRYVAALSGDHGAAPIPEYAQQMRLDSGRISTRQLAEAIDAALAAKWGPGHYVEGAEYPSVYLDHAVLQKLGVGLIEAEHVAATAAAAVPGISRAFAAADLEAPVAASDPEAEAYRLSYYPGRSGDVLVAPRPYFLWGYWADQKRGTTHDSGYSYDNHVPLALWGPAWVKPGWHYQRVDPAQLAPTLAELLEVEAPSCARGGILPDAIK